MADAFLATIRTTLPPEVQDLISSRIADLENGNFLGAFDSLVKRVVGLEHDGSLDDIQFDENADWNDFVFRRLNILINTKHYDLSIELSRTYRQHYFFLVAVAALQLFIQISVTGPPLVYPTASLLLPPSIAQDPKKLRSFRDRLVGSRSVDGIAAYRLTPSPELICLADTILTSPSIKKNVKAAPWSIARTCMLHQRLLSETSSTLQDQIYENLEQAWPLMDSLDEQSKAEAFAELHIERASIHLYHGFDKKAREDLNIARGQCGLEFALTGQLGKRTKFQEKETSQLVVLARSRDSSTNGESVPEASAPKTLDLNDDTLLESIAFGTTDNKPIRLGPQEDTDIPATLRSLDPNSQPKLFPLDSIILLLYASSITSASPVDGLTREESMPYALRVLEGGSSNWQVYTQALLVRSRIEGYRSRTAERGLLQLQALVDQIIADTTTASAAQDGMSTAEGTTTQSTFLPRPQASESATAPERLRYVHQLAAPTRWELETELAARWTSMGGLRSALEIYERLKMWSEVALCWASTDREDKAKRIIKRQLNHPTKGIGVDIEDEDAESWDGPPREPPPSDAPRLYCILGDLDKSPEMWEKAWTVSNGRYARAQRSLGRHYLANKDTGKAAECFAKSLKASQLDGASWFAYGCCLLELSRFEEAVQTFARVVQLDDQDAEAWSNLAAALVKRGPKEAGSQDNKDRQELLDDEESTANGGGALKVDQQRHLRDALRAFKRAATLKQDSPRIYDNVLTIAASLEPPAYSDIVAAQRRIIELRSKVEGESCIDEDIVDALVRDVIMRYETPSEAMKTGGDTTADSVTALQTTYRPGSVPALVIDLVTRHIRPLITRSAKLWSSVAHLSIWLNRPNAALEAHEKAWRIIIAGEAWERGNDKQWNEVVQATLDLADAYESLGPKERTEGLAASSGELVAKDWKFKARSAIRGVTGRAKDLHEGSEGWEKLQERLSELKGA